MTKFFFFYIKNKFDLKYSTVICINHSYKQLLNEKSKEKKRKKERKK